MPIMDRLKISRSGSKESPSPSPRGAKKVGNYELGPTLGEGSFAKVKQATHITTRETFAIKIISKEEVQRHNMGEQLKKEISVMKMIKHKNIVNLIEVLASRTKIFIVLELVSGGELFDAIVKAGKFDENKARHYFQQMVYAVDYCHKQGVMHRDLKPENLLLDSQGSLKVTDFGLSYFYQGADGSNLLHTTCGTPNYVAPEVLGDNGYDGVKADIWSCAIILYVLMAGCLPFDDQNMTELFKKIMNVKITYPSHFSSGSVELLKLILVKDPNKRLTMSQIKQHPWFRINLNEEEFHNEETPLGKADVTNAISAVDSPAPTRKLFGSKG
eukprot:GFYU01008716.1.p1 GENE.GFYU01008716.1~~GFYU01008716.1.p1  ORF type:complete len:329 (-),score=90.43 GFYU01008716.1:191-1177(-)